MRTKRLTLIVLVLMFIFPSLIHIGGISDVSSIGVVKTYTQSYEHHGQIWIQSNEEFSIQADAEGWDGDGSEEHPYVITGYFFDCETQPLRIWNTTVHWIFIDNVIDGVGDNVQCGTWLQNVSHGAIVDNEIYNRHTAIAIEVATDFNITGNYIHDCWGSGIEFMGGMNRAIIQDNHIENIGGAGIYSSTSFDSVVTGNNVSNCDSLGIGLLGFAPNCNVTDNVVSDCESKGIMMFQIDNGFVTGNTITHTAEGIYMNTPDQCVISENRIGEIDGKGIHVTSAESSDIVDNIVEDCTEDGILFTSGSNSSVHWNLVSNVTGYAVNLKTDSSHISVKYNTFNDNGITCQVCDDGTSNTVSQNYYDDWASPDADADGYVDSPYSLDGDADNQDEFPLAIAGCVPTTRTNEIPLPVELILMAGVLGSIVLVVAVFLVRRR